MNEPLVVTGLGLVTPLGSSRELTWSRLLEGRSGIRATEDGLAASVLDFSPNGARSRAGDFALMAVKEALDQADIKGNIRIGCAIGQSKPLIDQMDPALLLSSFTGWSLESVVKQYFHFDGPTSNVSAACSTGVASIAVGAQWLRQGEVDVALVGAFEGSLSSFYRAGFEQLGVLAHGSDGACVRPFDQHRQGFAMGEGGAVLVLERLSHAKKRNAPILAELTDVQLGHSSVHPIRFDPDGHCISTLIRKLAKTPIHYINAHGTGTPYNDKVESLGLREAMGNEIDDIPVSSTKAATGHLLGAAGAVEAAFSVLALRDQTLPPTLNLDTPDSECRLNHIQKKSKPHRVSHALSLSYGFGGQMGAVLFSKWNPTNSN